MVFFLVLLYPCDDGSCPLDYQVFQTVSLVQVSVHELLHCLSRKAIFFAFLVKLGLLLVNVIDQVSELPEG